MAKKASVNFEDGDDDPVVAEYDVFMTPEQSEQSFLLQYPNRDRSKPYGQAGEKPVQMRIKPKTGFMEIDVEVNVHSNFDKQKGAQWGEALFQAKESGAESFGMASGFGKSTRAEHFGADSGSNRADAGDTQQALDNFHRSNEEGRVLNKQTLGGQIMRPERGKPNYMLGAFRGKELHLTPIDGTVQMRPQFHHVDAQSQAARNKYWRERDALEGARPEPRMMQHLQVAKSSADGEEFNITQTAKYLADAAEEPWTKLNYHDENSEEAYAAYRDKLFLKDTATAPPLKAAMGNEQYLDAISAPRADPSGRTKKKPMTKKQRLALEEESDGAPEPQSAPTAQVPAAAAMTRASTAKPKSPIKTRGKKTDG